MDTNRTEPGERNVRLIVDTIESVNRDMNFYSFMMGVGFGLLSAAAAVISTSVIAAAALGFLGLPITAAFWLAHWKLSKAKREYKSEVFGD